MMCFDVRRCEGQAAIRLDYGDGQLVNCGDGPATTMRPVPSVM